MINITITDTEKNEKIASAYADRFIGLLGDVRDPNGEHVAEACAMVNGRFSTEDQVELLAVGIHGLFGTLERQTKISKTVLKMLLHAKLEILDEEDDEGDGDDHTD